MKQIDLANNSKVEKDEPQNDKKIASRNYTGISGSVPIGQTFGKPAEPNRQETSKVKIGILKQQSYEIRSGSQGRSWGHKIRTEIMTTQKGKLERKMTNDIPSRVSLNCRDSLIVNGEKIDIHKLNVGDISENISEKDKTTERYYDEDFDFFPQMRRISYNNIDVER
jgi:hypothetical protein